MIFVLFAGLLFIGIASATVVAIIVVLSGMGKRSGRATLVRLGICLVPISAYVLFCAWIFGPADYYSRHDLAGAYQTEFGSLPPDDVVGIQARQVVVGDSGVAWLRFQASSQTIDGLLTKFVASDRSTFTEAGSGGNVPSWWTPDTDHVETFYTAEHWSKGFSNSTAYLGVNREQGIVYFNHRGSD